jgi:predicted signal transduction protein with EAL and GGDEF domain
MREPNGQLDEMQFQAEDDRFDAVPRAVWKVLVVDDDEDVHAATRFALKHARILDRPLELIHASSAQNAQERVKQCKDIAVALIDVVMETSDAGLLLVHQLRAAGLQEMRIVLRTGQPGYAPEIAVIAAYQIDDYRTKAELTQTRLMTVLTASIRAYEQICTINRSRVGLEMIVESAAQLFQRTNLELFSQGVLTQIAGLLGIVPHGLVCIRTVGGKTTPDSRIVSAAGRFAPLLGKTREAITDPVVLRLADQVSGRAEPVIRDGYLAICCSSEHNRHLVAIIETGSEIVPADLSLLRLFSTNIAVGFENLALVERLDRLAYLDPVLQVPNLNAFQVALQQRSAGASVLDRLALISVDTYQSTVAAYGQHVAHGLLSAIHQKLSSERLSTSCIARIGDAQFAVLADRRSFDAALIISAFEKPCRIDGIEIAAAGTAVLMDLEDTAVNETSILREANAALLHVAQTRRGDCVVYDATTRSAVARRISLQIALKEAMKRGAAGLEVYVQPKYDLNSRAIVGSEALLRWTHDGNAVAPAEFIPIAESTGLIQGLTEFVVHEVGRWQKNAGHRPLLPVAINLSMADLNASGFAAWLLRELVASGLAPGAVEFEVTEGIAMQETPWAIQQVQLLKETGFRIALDDFGTGYCSLGHFERLPIDIIKIDRRFISPLNLRTARSSLAAVIIGMSQALEVDCVAEGVETTEQEEALRLLGCTLGQGYLFGRPVPFAQFEKQHGMSR